MKRIFYFIVLVFPALCHAQQAADVIYTNARIWTGDAENPWASSMGIKDSTIVFAGNDYTAFKGASTLIKNLNGKLVVPGFTDNHTHFLSGGFQLVSVDLRNVRKQEDFKATVQAYAGKLQANRWILGGDWDHEAWGGELPTKEWIDAAAGDHPVFINRYDGHMALANTLALKKAGITAKTPDPPGGTIDRDANGQPTGILRDEAMGLVYAVIPQPTTSELDEAFLRAQQHALSFGLTQVHDMGSYGGWTDLKTYQRAQQNKQLHMRVYSFVALASWEQLKKYTAANGKGNAMLHWGGLKGFVDGSLGSTTAWFYQPYLDAPSSTGLQVTDTTLLRKWIINADSAGLQVATHAIGDRANDWLISVYQEAAALNGNRDRRFRIEHAQHLTQTAIRNLGPLHIIPSMQPYHAIDDGKWAYKRLDDARLKGTYAFKDLLQYNANLTFGSDWSVAPLNPIQGIYAAVTRRTLDAQHPGGWYPEQKISVEAALRCYTVNNAYAGFQENKLGMLKAGMLADFAVLSDDLFTIAPEHIQRVQVVLTVVNGKEVFKR